jgi:hypothetical protein
MLPSLEASGHVPRLLRLIGRPPSESLEVEPLATNRSHFMASLSVVALLALAAPVFASEAGQLPSPGVEATGGPRPEAERVIEAATLYLQLGAYHMAYQQLFAVDQKTFHDVCITAMVRRLEADPHLSTAIMAEIRHQAEARWKTHSN